MQNCNILTTSLIDNSPASRDFGSQSVLTPSSPISASLGKLASSRPTPLDSNFLSSELSSPGSSDSSSLPNEAPSFLPAGTLELTLSPSCFFRPSLHGIIIPSEWKNLKARRKTEEGEVTEKKLTRGAIELYAIIVSWFMPKKVKDKKTGEIVFVAKFEGDELRKNYAYFMKELGVGQEQVRRYFTELRAANLVSMELRNVWHKFWRYENTLCIKLNKEADHFKGKVAEDCNPASKETYAPEAEAIRASLERSKISFEPEETISSLDKNNSLEFTTEIALKCSDAKNEKTTCSTHLKVGSTPPKSGVYISNNYLKTNNNKISIDQGISNFANPFFTNSNTSNLTLSNSSNSSESNLELETAKLNQITNSAIKEQKNESEEEKLLIQASPFTKASSLQLKKPKEQKTRKPLSAFHPLSEMDAIFLRKASNRPFNLSFINKLLLRLAEKYPNHGFYKKTLLLSYLTEALKGEKYDAEVVNNETFYFKPIEGTLEHKTNLQNNYLKKIELSSDISLVTKIKQKIIGLSAGDAEYAYHLITNTSLPYIQDTLKESSIAVKVSSDITTEHKKTLTKAVKEVMGMQTCIIFKYKENKQNSCTKTPDIEPELSSSPAPSSPLWQKIRSILKQRFKDKGEALDKTWFAKLDIELKEEANTNQIKQILIKCPSPFVKDWIKTNYDHEIESAVADLALTTKEISTQSDRENQISQETESETTILQPETLLPIAFNPNSIKNLRFEYVAN